MFDDTVPETQLYTDDVQMIANLLKESWSLGIGKEPSIAYKPESVMINSRYGAIYVYLVHRNMQPSSTDYRTLQKVTHIGIKITSRFREAHFEICNEVYRIILANRRAGKDMLGGYTYMEPTNERVSNDSTGWYLTTIDVKLTSYSTPIRTAGFGDEINKSID